MDEDKKQSEEEESESDLASFKSFMSSTYSLLTNKSIDSKDKYSALSGALSSGDAEILLATPYSSPSISNVYVDTNAPVKLYNTPSRTSLSYTVSTDGQGNSVYTLNPNVYTWTADTVSNYSNWSNPQEELRSHLKGCLSKQDEIDLAFVSSVVVYLNQQCKFNTDYFNQNQKFIPQYMSKFTYEDYILRMKFGKFRVAIDSLENCTVRHLVCYDSVGAIRTLQDAGNVLIKEIFTRICSRIADDLEVCI